MTRLTFNLSEEGISTVYAQRKSQGLTYEKLAGRAYLSVSTVKRFARGQQISVDSFKHLCRVLGLEDWQRLVEGIDSDSAKVPCQDLSPPQQEEVGIREAVGTLAVRGTFSQSKQLQIATTLEVLKDLLLDGKVRISPCADSLENERDCGNDCTEDNIYDRRLAPMFRALEQQEIEQREAEEKIGAIAVTGVFSRSKQLQIEATLTMLQELLLESKVYISPYEEKPKE